MFTKKWKNVLVAVCALTLSVSSVIGGLTFKKVQASDAQPTVVNPIAKYEFKDATNPGKDSMGNYDLVVRASDGLADGAEYSVPVENGIAKFNGTAGLIAANDNDVSDVVESFTLVFSIKLPQANSGWNSPIGFGWNGWDPTKWAPFMFSSGSNLLRFSTASALVDGKSNVCGCHGNAFWGHEIGNVAADAFSNVTLVIDKAGLKATVYFNGDKKYEYSLPADYSLVDSNMRFAIGGDSCWGNLYNKFTGEIANVAIYDFAMNEAEMTAFWANGELTTATVDKAQSAAADFSDSIIVEETATDEDIVKLAPASSIIDVTMESGATRKGLAKWTGVEVVDGQKMLVGTLTSVYNPDGVKAYGKFAMIAEVKPIAPIAKYEFLDPENPGKDSMGNYDLQFRVSDTHEEGYIQIENGVAMFDGTAGLQSYANNDIADKLDSFTMNFEINLPANVQGSNQGWGSPISMTGFNDWTATKWNWFHFSGNSNLLRFSSVGDGSANPYWGAEIAKLNLNEWYKVSMVVNTEAKNITVYLNGVALYNKAIDDTYSIADGSSRFCIGGASCWGNVYTWFQGNLKNVSIYDFAMTADQIGVYGNTGELKSNSLLTESWIESVDTTLTFADDKVVTAELFEDMTSAQKVSLMGSATVVATLSNLSVQKSQITLPVIWTAVEEVEGKWIAKGYVENTGLSLPAISTAKVEVTQEVPVSASYKVGNGEMENGTLKAEKTWGVEGDVVVIAAKPAEHYELSKMYANGVEIVPVEGVYSIVVGTEDIVLTADFVAHQYSITAGEMENGTVTFQSEGTAFGTTVTITPVPNKYYVATNVYVNGEEIAPDGAVYTFKVAGDAVVTASFAEAVYSVDAYVVGSNGTVDVGGITSSKGGVNLVINVTPAEGYVVDYVEVNGTAIEAVEGVYSIIIEGDTEIEVKFEAVYTVNAYVTGENGTVDIGGITSSTAGETLVINVTPADGYVVDCVNVNGVAIEAVEGVYSIVIEGNTEIEVKFKENIKSCKSVMASGSILTLILLAGASVVLFKKKD